MSDLSRRARIILEAEALDDGVPDAVRRCGRERLRRAIATGAIAGSAITAKSAVAGASVASTASLSMGGTLVTALAIGLSTGLMAISPTTGGRLTRETAQSRPTPQPPGNSTQRAKPSVKLVYAPSGQPSVDLGASSELPKARSARSSDAPASRRDLEPEPTIKLHVIAEEASARRPTVVRAAEAESAPAALSPPQTRGKASIARETVLLGQAQRALSARQYGVALDQLDQYAREFPSGQLREEATVSRVVTLCAMGRLNEGRRWAALFLGQYPDSPLASRVSDACANAIGSRVPAKVTNE
jgi:hypothetical protein